MNLNHTQPSKTKTKTNARNQPRKKVFAFLVALASVSLAIALCSCSGYTNASNSGKLLNPAMLSVNVASIAFGSVPLSGTATQTVTITNIGKEVANVLEGVSGNGFMFDGGKSSFSIPAGQSVTLDLRITPQVLGPFAGTFVLSWAGASVNEPPLPRGVSTDDEQERGVHNIDIRNQLTLSLSGTAIQAQGQLTTTPAVIDFGDTAVGNANSHSITLTNAGNTAVTISESSVSGTGFSVSGLLPTQTIPAKKSVTFTGTFQPAIAGSAVGVISINNNASESPVTIALSGTGTQARISANPSSASFGSVAAGSANSQPILLTNTGNAPLTFSQVRVSGAGFSITGLSTSNAIPPGGSMMFDAVFNPAASGVESGSVLLTTNGSPSELAIGLSGTGQNATHSLTANPASLNFNNVTVGSGESLTTTITNNGNSNVTISGVTVSGTGFAASGALNGTTLLPNQSVTLAVVFTPSAAGPVTGASVSLANNATSPLKIALVGTGQTAASHSVALSWMASTSGDVTGYYLYRGTTPGQYAKINAAMAVPASQLTFTDATVQAGSTYYYVVTSVGSDSVESAFSNSATATIP